MSKAEDLRKEAEEAGKRGDKSLRKGAQERRREKALNDMADNEDWLDGKPNPQPEKKISDRCAGHCGRWSNLFLGYRQIC
jgi:hypothetical protein